MGHLVHEGEEHRNNNSSNGHGRDAEHRRRSKRAQMSEAFRRVVDRVDAAREESENEAVSGGEAPVCQLPVLERGSQLSCPMHLQVNRLDSMEVKATKDSEEDKGEGDALNPS